jgi:prephenate dehydrogenase
VSASFNRVCVVGTGLIGGSFASAVRPVLPGARILGWDKPEVLQRAVAMHIIDEPEPDLGKAVAEADLVYVALPVGMTITRLNEIARQVSPTALVTDAASTKRAVCAEATRCFKNGACFLGGHPMAGNEGSGLAAAHSDIFRGTRYALIRDAHGDFTSDGRVASFVGVLEAMGASLLWMDAETHDRAAAIISHIPQLVAIALAGVVHESTDSSGLPLSLAARGLRDALRVAGSPYSLWRDIVLTNTDNIEAALDRMMQAVEHLRSNLRQPELEHEFARANEVYALLREQQ